MSAFANAQVVDTTWIEENKIQQKRYVEELRKTGKLDLFSEERIEEKTQKFQSEATTIGINSVKQRTFSEAQYEGMEENTNGEFSSNSSKSSPGTLKAIFISFAMSNKELKEALISASDAGAEVYVNGLHPDDESIGHTMQRMRDIAVDIDNRPITRFNPKAFQEFNVDSVPYVISLSAGKVLSVSGLLNFDWLDKQGENILGRHHFGVQGPQKPVIEKNLLEEIQLRLSRVNFEDKKKAAFENFWVKREFVKLPSAKKDELWYIDPTVKVTNDIVNSQGQILARKGDIINPLASVPALNTYVVFNATDSKQLAWADTRIKSGKLAGTVMLLSSELNREKGWDHLSALRKNFQQEIYLLPKEMIERFNLTSLPVVISTDLSKKMLKVEQFKVD